MGLSWRSRGRPPGDRLDAGGKIRIAATLIMSSRREQVLKAVRVDGCGGIPAVKVERNSAKRAEFLLEGWSSSAMTTRRTGDIAIVARLPPYASPGDARQAGRVQARARSTSLRGPSNDALSIRS